MSDALRDIIRRSVMGESELWPIDPHFPAVGSFEDRFNAGDKQIFCGRSTTTPRGESRSLNGPPKN